MTERFVINNHAQANINPAFLDYEKDQYKNHPDDLRCSQKIERSNGSTWTCNYRARHFGPHDAWAEGIGRWLAHWETEPYIIQEEPI